MSYHDTSNRNICINIENSIENKFDECVICLEITKKNITFFECTKYHHICDKCIYLYRQRFSNFTCPICRAKPINRICFPYFGFTIDYIYRYLLDIVSKLKNFGR